MNSEEIESARPFARMMANEVPTEDVDLMAKRGVFVSVRSGGAFNDWPDMG